MHKWIDLSTTVMFLFLPAMITSQSDVARRMIVISDVMAGGVLLDTLVTVSRVQCAVECTRVSSVCAAYHFVAASGATGSCELRGINNLPLLSMAANLGYSYVYDRFFGMTYDGSLDKWYSTSLEGPAIWQDASAICSSRGQHLMHITGPEEQTKLDSFGGGRDFWIGIYRPTGTALNNFVYDKDHSPITWDNWLPGDPDRLLSNEAMPADCGRACGLVSVSGSRKWCDAPCSRLCYFVCEMKISP